MQALQNLAGRARHHCEHVLQSTEWLTQVLDGEESVTEVLDAARVTLALLSSAAVLGYSTRTLTGPLLCCATDSRGSAMHAGIKRARRSRRCITGPGVVSPRPR